MFYGNIAHTGDNYSLKNGSNEENERQTDKKRKVSALKSSHANPHSQTTIKKKCLVWFVFLFYYFRNKYTIHAIVKLWIENKKGLRNIFTVLNSIICAF